MRKNLNKLTLSFLALLFFVSACKDNNDDPSPGGGNNKDCLVTEMKLEDETISFVYTSNLLTQIKTISINAADNENYNLEYNANQQVTKTQVLNSDNSSDLYITYEYNTDGLVSKTNYFYKDANGTTFENEVSITSEYTNKVLTRSTTLANLNYMGIDAVAPVDYTDYTVAAGNITKTTHYTLDENWLAGLDSNNLPPQSEFMKHMELWSTTEYQYDDKKNPLKALSFINFVIEDVSTLSANNITTKVEKEKSGTTTNTTTIVYEYNTEGYPTKQTATETNSTPETTTLSYDCQ
ncbi:hypothetical protein AHMF7605_08670 [Adhaeribacter arboris]|uniref:DUF4595 domain-containing protein n=1 Tax=Adhaeribacter arboris TaxID=2072846 RepID=A0A2T2YDK4_9BACT|nr:hypothetical protein [Adhaeribacter arboris]PSR53595.1 hypothetical protein AHMF7605_08670 [Adhaeribacter arboris]